MTGDPVIRRTGSDGSIERTGADRQQVMQDPAYLSYFYLYVFVMKDPAYLSDFYSYVFMMKDPAYLSDFYFMYL